MTSRHYRWQTRWHVNLDTAQATHDSGLVVTLARAPPGARSVWEGRCARAALAAMLVQLEIKHGPHNAPKMLARLVREAETIYLEALHREKA